MPISDEKMPGAIKALMPRAIPWLRGDQDPALRRATYIGPFSRINVFVGPNNSGKSRVLRELAGQPRNVNVLATGWPHDEFRQALEKATTKKLKEQITAIAASGTSTSPAAEYLLKLLAQESSAELAALVALDEQRPSFTALMNMLAGSIDGSSALYQLMRQVADHKDAYRDSQQHAIANRFERRYVPLLRTLRPATPMSDSGKGAMLARTIKDHGDQVAPIENHIYTGEDLYGRFQRLRLGSPADRRLLDQYERFLSKWFFDGRRLFLTARLEGKNDVLHVGFEEEGSELPVYRLGDGISQIVMLTFPLFVSSSNPVLLFVEEPETSLHPGLQRRLIEAWLDDSFVEMPPRQIFLTTHSTAFLDITLDQTKVSVFQIQREGSELLPDHGQPIRVRFASGGARRRDRLCGDQSDRSGWNACLLT